MKKKIVVFLLAGALAATSLTGCGKIKDTDVVATVGDTEITADVANFMARYTQAQYETYYAGYMGEDMWSSEAEKGKSYEESVKDTILESLENMYILDQHKKDYNVELTKEEKNSIQAAASDFDKANGLAEKEKVSGNKETVEKVLELLTVQKKTKDAIEAGADTEVSDEEAAQKKMQYVQFPFTTTDESGNSKELTEDEKAALKTQAETFAGGAAGAADFAAYATEQGTEARDSAFDAKTVTLPEELVKAADQLGEGETTGVVETDTGYYVAKVTSLFDREATDAKKKEIVEERQQKLFDDTIKKLRKDTDIKENKRVWKKVDFNKLSVTVKQETTEPYTDGAKTDDQAESGQN